METTNFKEDVLNWAEHIGASPKEIHVREMRRKWASCSTRGRVTFSFSLLKEPFKQRHAAIVHELLHLKYPNHGKMFKALLNTYLSVIAREELPFRK